MINSLDLIREPCWRLSRKSAYNGIEFEPVFSIDFPKSLLEVFDFDFLRAKSKICDFASQLTSQEEVVTNGSIAELSVERFQCIGVYNHPTVELDPRKNPKLRDSIVLVRAPVKSGEYEYYIYYLSDRINPADGYPFLYQGYLIPNFDEGNTCDFVCGLMTTRGDDGTFRSKDLSTVLTCNSEVMEPINGDRFDVLTEISYWKPGTADKHRRLHHKGSTADVDNSLINKPLLPIPLPI